jgi:hypothetical protein
LGYKGFVDFWDGQGDKVMIYPLDSQNSSGAGENIFIIHMYMTSYRDSAGMAQPGTRVEQQFHWHHPGLFLSCIVT